MKIANTVRRFVFEEWGGTESAVWNLSQRLRLMGHEPEILATKALQSLSEETKRSVKIRRFDYFYPHIFLGKNELEALDKKGGNPFSMGLYKYILNGKFDIVHSHALGRIAKVSVMAAKKLGAPSVLTFHGGYLDVPQSEARSMQKPIEGKIGYGAVLERLMGMPKDAAPLADGIICVGKNEYEKMRELFPRKKIAHIPNGVDFEKFNAPKLCDFRRLFSIPRRRKLILCVSRIDPQKNQLSLLRLLKELLKSGEDAHLALAGFVTDKNYLRQIFDFAKSQNLSGRLTFCGAFPPESPMLVSAYKSADVFAIASAHEPFGIVVLEAWAAGTAVIASNAGGLGRLVEDGKTGFLFEPNDAAGMAGAYFKSKKMKALTVQNAKKICREKYSWESAARKTLDFYREVSA